MIQIPIWVLTLLCVIVVIGIAPTIIFLKLFVQMVSSALVNTNKKPGNDKPL